MALARLVLTLGLPQLSLQRLNLSLLFIDSPLGECKSATECLLVVVPPVSPHCPILSFLQFLMEFGIFPTQLGVLIRQEVHPVLEVRHPMHASR